MVKLNENFQKLESSYLFSEIAKRITQFTNENPDKKIIRLGIGDVTQPLPDAVVGALHKAVDEMGAAATFRGYGPEQGYSFLREAIINYDYNSRGIALEPDEVFVSDGAKSDAGNIVDIFSQDNKVAVCDPVYPVYVDTNVMSGRSGTMGANGRWTDLHYMPCVAENGFVPQIPEKPVDMIYLCFPNNPTGGVLTKQQLSQWVDYAIQNKSIILFDSAYEAFVQDKDIPRSIYEIEGAKRCAIEFRSFSKTAGFTGTRCAYTVVPKELKFNNVSVNAIWNRRQCTKFNGVAYIIQRAAQAVYSEEGQKQVKKMVGYYMENAAIIVEGLKNKGFTVFGGTNAPYIWLKTPQGVGSWEFFDQLLNHCGVVGTPGAGFGPSGEGYFRITAFGSRENTMEAMERIKQYS